MHEVVICLGEDNFPQFVFGEFKRLKGGDFIPLHEEVCKRKHIVRKMNKPKFGVKNG